MDVRVAVASYDLAKQWDEALDRADDVHNALQSFLKAEAKADVKEVAAVKVDVKVDKKKPPDETAPELQLDVTDVSDFDINDRRRYHGDFKRKPPKQSWDDYNAPNPK